MNAWPALVLWIATALASGRVLLSFLPPGRVGSHRGASLATTLAASLLLGFAALWASSALLDHLANAASIGFLVALLALGALRWWLRPLAFVPPHEVARSKDGWTRVLVAAACVAPLTWTGSADFVSRFWSLLESLLTAEFVLYGLAASRRSVLGRAAVATTLVVALQCLETSSMPHAWFACAAGGAFSIDWLRRADRRSLWLAAIAFAFLSLASWAVAAAGFATLVLATHRNARRAASIAAATAVVVVALPAHSTSDWSWPDGGSEPTPTVVDAFAWASRWSVAWIPLGFGAVAALSGVAGGRLREASLDGIDVPRREAHALASFLVVAFVLHALAVRLPVRPPWNGGGGWAELLALLLPAGALVFGQAFLPSERAGARA